MDHVDAEVEVLAEAALLDRGLEVAVGGGDDAHVDRHLAVAADRANAPLLQRAQELRAAGWRHVADLVEEQRAAVGLHEQPGARRLGVGERAPGVAEQLALEQRLGHGRAVDGDERARAPASGVVQRARHQLLAGAALAGDEHRGVGVGHPLDQLVHLPHGGALADQVRHRPGTLDCSRRRRTSSRSARCWTARSSASASVLVSNGLVTKS